MDKKEKQLVNHYYKKFSERSFDEKDVYSFLMVIKEHASDIKAIKELAEFIAHREKSTGYAKEYLDKCKEIINNLGKEKNRRKIENIFSFKEIRNGFNALFQQLGLEKLPLDIINDFIICMISLLQDVKIVSGSLNKEVGHLSFAASSKELFLMGNMTIRNQGRFMPVTFPVLSVKNIYEKITPQDKNDTPYLFDHELMEVININQKLAITFPEMNA
ncbi:hypothetical protein JSQ81_01600 [Sporosarcina sp. Marseille-Q4063]|uniref:hypothetical protein n=1 Tax=Sporosarcina sp. Marseille-Q4063 TaxID=2810514 RepID=UPI001BB0CCA8|nr:hypothetical protein [Sporosarcina sp. Marseille-Q4063]QUW22314.1 hypothetical protein JSQ81_01600 [Sporosarcina sp. Marseille-Q4063]